MLAPVSGVDPVLLRQLASIGSNVNQIAHQVNSGALVGTTLDMLSVLTELQQIERHLRAIAAHRS
jgi:7,8-dihydro-6-hydroxymethylpterin-pyrophosphokinase